MINCTECDGSGIVETVLGDGFTSFGTCLTCQRRNMADDYPRIAELNRNMKQALEWYADEKNWRLGVEITMGSAFPKHEAVKSDKGNRAREALKEGEQK